jgi:methyltransferase (TIGR00027 family)
MEPNGQPSRTSLMVAAARAFGAREPDASVRNPDYLAAQFLGPEELQLIGEHPIAAALGDDYDHARQGMEVASISNMMLARTRFIDDHLQKAVANGATQVVILGAGFDTRAYRFAESLKGRKVFEVDYHSTQAAKRRRVAEVLGQAPGNVVFVEIDFQGEKLEDVLRSAHFQAGEKTFFIWEGVSMYLAESAVKNTLRTIATVSAPGSSLVMDFASKALLELIAKLPGHPMQKFTTGWGEPWIFGVPDGKESEFFRNCGLELREVLTFAGKEAASRYFTRADGTRIGRGKPDRSAAQKLSFMQRISMLGKVARMLISRSKGYALVELVVSR